MSKPFYWLILYTYQKVLETEYRTAEVIIAFAQVILAYI